MKVRNPHIGRALFFGLAAAATGAASGLLARRVDLMAGGFVIGLAAGAIAIASAWACVAHVLRARWVRKLRGRRDILADWVAGGPAIPACSDAAEGDPDPGAFALAAAGLVLGAGVWVGAPGPGRVAAAVLWCLSGAVAARRLLGPRLARSGPPAGPREVIVARAGGLVGDRLHAWGSLGGEVASAALEPGRVLVLRVSYSVPSLFGRRHVVAAIPVAPGLEARAAAIAQELARGAMEDEDEGPRG